MKVKNEYIKIKNGNKTITFTNRILDEYLKIFADANLVSRNNRKYFSLDYLFLKFDTNIEEKNEYLTTDFDGLITLGTTKNVFTNSNNINIVYRYEITSDSEIYLSDTLLPIRTTSIKEYYGRRITAIGFASVGRWSDGNKICAILDTSKQNIVLQDKQDFSLIRSDKINTDAIFYTRVPSITHPVHLNPCGGEMFKEIKIENDIIFDTPNSIANLYSIGTSPAIGMMQNEILLSNADVIFNDNTITFNNFINKELGNYINPCNSLHPSNLLYPLKSNQNYIVLKYEIYKIVETSSESTIIQTPIKTGKFYYMYFPSTTYGKGKIEIKYERSRLDD